MNNNKSEKKLKKRKHKVMSDNEEEEIVHKQPKKKKKVKTIREEENDAIETEEYEKPVSVGIESPRKTVKEDVDGDSWTKEEYAELIKRMEAQLPKNDTISFTSRIEKLNWDQITFGSHSVDECYEKWKLIRSKIRHFRLLSEVLDDAKTWVVKPWETFSKKKTRHPEQPPRPLSSFMLFYMDKKNRIIKKYPELKLTEISRLIGEKYKNLSEVKKAYYLERAKQMQEEYRQNLGKFYEKYPELVRVSKKQTVNTNKPLTPFKLYLKDKLQKHQNSENYTQHELVEKYKELWKSLGTKKKAYWIRVAKDEEEKYLEHSNEDLTHDGEHRSGKTKYKSVISKEENAILDRLAGKPEKPPNSAYSLFSRLMLQDKDHNYVDGEPKNRMREIANKWKETSEDQKKAYAERVKHMHETYKLEFANYLDSLPEEKRIEELAKVQPKKKAARSRQKIIKKGPETWEPPKQELFKNEPEKPPVTAWDLYKYEFFKQNSNLSSKAAHKKAAMMWKNLTVKEVEKYKKKHNQMKEKYMVDFEEFLKTLNEDELKEYSSLKTAKFVQNSMPEESLDEASSSSEVEEVHSSGCSDDSSEDSGVSEEEY